MGNASRHYEQARLIPASVGDVFHFLDVPQNLSKHMEKPTWRMLWAWIRNRTDDRGGQDVGSVISMEGSLLGVRLFLVEKVIAREVPYRKSWQTFGDINLLVIGHYTMGYELAPEGTASRLRIYIDYQLPNSLRTRWLGHLFGDLYARWCVRQMLHDAAAHFNDALGGATAHDLPHAA